MKPLDSNKKARMPTGAALTLGLHLLVGAVALIIVVAGWVELNNEAYRLKLMELYSGSWGDAYQGAAIGQMIFTFLAACYLGSLLPWGGLLLVRSPRFPIVYMVFMLLESVVLSMGLLSICFYWPLISEDFSGGVGLAIAITVAVVGVGVLGLLIASLVYMMRSANVKAYCAGRGNQQ